MFKRPLQITLAAILPLLLISIVTITLTYGLALVDDRASSSSIADPVGDGEVYTSDGNYPEPNPDVIVWSSVAQVLTTEFRSSTQLRSRRLRISNSTTRSDSPSVTALARL